MTDTSCGGRTLVGELVEHRGHGVNGAVQDEERGPVVAPLEKGLVVGAEVVERVLCGGGQGGGHGRARIANVRQLAQRGAHSGQLHHTARITRTQCEKVAVSGHDAVLAVSVSVAVVCVCVCVLCGGKPFGPWCGGCPGRCPCRRRGCPRPRPFPDGTRATRELWHPTITNTHTHAHGDVRHDPVREGDVWGG